MTDLHPAIARMTDIEGEILSELGMPLDTIVAFGREWERRCLPELQPLAAAYGEYDAALTSVTELLDQARTERDALLNEMERLKTALRTRNEKWEQHAREVAWTSVQGRDAEIDRLRAELARHSAAYRWPTGDPAVTSSTAAVAEWEEGKS